MDAAPNAREAEKQRLLKRLCELMVDEQRELGTFDAVPHFSTLEQAARALGQELSRTAQERSAREVAAACEETAACPGCHRQRRVSFEKRTVAGLDGPVELTEPTAHCPACRRDFFPSAYGVGLRQS